MSTLKNINIKTIGKRSISRRKSLIAILTVLSLNAISPNATAFDAFIDSKNNNKDLSMFLLDHNQNKEPIKVLKVTSHEGFELLKDKEGHILIDAFVYAISNQIESFKKGIFPESGEYGAGLTTSSLRDIDNNTCIVASFDINDDHEHKFPKDSRFDNPIAKAANINHELGHCKLNLEFLSQYSSILDKNGEIITDKYSKNKGNYIKHLNEIYADASAIAQTTSSDRENVLEHFSNLRKAGNDIEHSDKAFVDFIYKNKKNISWPDDNANESERQVFAEQLIRESYEHGYIIEEERFLNLIDKVDFLAMKGMVESSRKTIGDILTNKYDPNLMNPSHIKNFKATHDGFIDNFVSEIQHSKKAINLSQNTKPRKSVLDSIVGNLDISNDDTTDYHF